MDWETTTIEQLQTLYDALGVYIQARQQQERQHRLAQLGQEKDSLGLELSELRAALAAHEEMAARLKQVLHLPELGTQNGKKPARAKKEAAADGLAFDFGDIATL